MTDLAPLLTKSGNPVEHKCLKIHPLIFVYHKKMILSLKIGICHPQFVFKFIFFNFMTNYGGHFEIDLVAIVTRFFSGKNYPFRHLHYIWHWKPLVEKFFAHFYNPNNNEFKSNISKLYKPLYIQK